MQLGQLQERLEEFAAGGATVVAVAVDDLDTSASMVEDLGLTFRVLSDPQLAVTRAYGIEEVGKDIARPATFVVDRGGSVVFAYVGTGPKDRPLVDALLASLPTN